jgi:hypothetical protein
MSNSHLYGALLAVVISIVPLSKVDAALLTATCEGEITCITGITSLNINGTAYDVDFIYNSFENLFGDPSGSLSKTPFFWGDILGANAAANAIADFVQTSAVTPYFNTPSSSSVRGYTFIPYSETDNIRMTGANCNLTTIACGTFDGSNGGIGFSGAYATFSVSSVPIPAAAWLFGSGLLGLIGMTRRKKV